VAKSKVTTAVALLPTAVQKQQVVAAFTVSGTLERARPLIATLWGVEEAELPDDVVLREWVADPAVVPEKEQMALADRMTQARHRAGLLDLEDEVIEKCKGKVREGSEKFFTLLGALKIIGARVDPMVAQKITVYDMQGASFKTTKKYRGLNEETEEAIEGDFTELEVSGGD